MPGPRLPRLHRMLLWLLPPTFRARFAPDMRETLRLDREAATREGTEGRWYVRSALGLARTAVGEWGSRGRSRASSPGIVLRDVETDLRVATRALRRDPAFTLTAVLALGIGIGLTTAALSIVWGTLLRGLPFDDAHELVHFERANDERDNLTVVPHDLVEWRSTNRTFEGLAAYTEAIMSMERADGYAERVYGSRIESRAFALLGVQPARGRLLTEIDDVPGGAPVVLISDALHRRRFGSDPEVVGRELRLNDVPHTVVGVMPPGFAFPLSEEYWIPLRLDLADYVRGEGRLDVFGRMRPGVDLDEARADFDRVSRALAERWPGTNAGIRAVLRAYTDEYVDEEFGALIRALLVAAVLVLLLASLNVANLMMARGTRQVRELAVRVSLGAARGRVVRHLAAEAAVIGLAAGAVGLALAWVGVRWFAGTGTRPGTFELAHGGSVPFWWDVTLDPVALSMVLFVTLGTVALATSVPALRALRTDPNLLLRAETRGGSASTSLLARAVVVAEIAIAGGVLTVSGLMAKSVLRLADVGGGIDTDGVVLASLALPDARLGGDESAFPTLESRLRFWDSVRSELERSTGVRAAAVTTAIPFLPARHDLVRVPGAETTPGEPDDVATALVDPGYFPLLGVDPDEGRLFDARDTRAAEPVVVVNRSFVERWMPGGAVGRSIDVPGPDGTLTPARVVGVVPDLWMDGIGDVEPEGVYRPVSQGASTNRQGIFDRRELRYGRVMVKTSGKGISAGASGVAGASGQSGAAAIRRVVDRLGPGLPVYGFSTLEGTLTRVGGQYRLYGTTYMVFGGVALIMVVVGLYGLVAYTVGQREREIGIRMALGAGSAGVVALILRRSLTLVGLGVAGGLVVALWLRGAIQLVLYGVDPADATVLGVVFGLLLVATTVASAIPALKASRIDPRDAMRSEV